jgi:hypothetical protein
MIHMAKGSKKSSKKNSGEKLRALMRTQAINDILSKSITESEALQNSGDDRPIYDSHVNDLLENKTSGETKMSSQRKRPSKTAKSSKKKSKPKKKR